MTTPSSSQVTASDWFGSPQRQAFRQAIDAVPFWRRFLIARVLCRGEAKNANALARAARLALRSGHNALFASLLVLSDRAYADLYGIDVAIPEAEPTHTASEMEQALRHELERRQNAENEVLRLRNLCRAMRQSWARRLGRGRGQIETSIPLNWP